MSDVSLEKGKSFKRKGAKAKSGEGNPSKKHRSAPSRLGKFSFYRDDEDREIGGFIYRRMHVIDVPMLWEGRGVRVLKSMGLASFAEQCIPSLDKGMCDEFISSFDPKTSTGTVRGSVVKLDETIVAAATKLPVGAAQVPTLLTAQHRSTLKKMLMDSSDKKSRGYDLGQLVYGEDVHVFAAVASMLMVKLECKKDSFNYVSSEVLVALDTSYQWDIEINWAEYLLRIMTKAVTLQRSSVVRHLVFPFGEWLTKIIKCTLLDRVQVPSESDAEDEIEDSHTQSEDEIEDSHTQSEDEIEESHTQSEDEEEQGSKEDDVVVFVNDEWRYRVELEKKLRIELGVKLQKMEEYNAELKLEVEKLHKALGEKNVETIKYTQTVVQVISLAQSAYNELKKENDELKNANLML